MALSLTGYVDYNLALLHGPGAVAATPRVLAAIETARVPAMVMLTGPGLAAADVLRDAGWVCTGAMPFMARSYGPMFDDPDVRLLGAGELADARALAAAAFGVPEEVGAAVGRPDRQWRLTATVTTTSTIRTGPGSAAAGPGSRCTVGIPAPSGSPHLRASTPCPWGPTRRWWSPLPG